MPYIIITQDNRGEETIVYAGQGTSSATMPPGLILYPCATASTFISTLNEIDPYWENYIELNPTKL